MTELRLWGSMYLFTAFYILVTINTYNIISSQRMLLAHFGNLARLQQGPGI